MKAAVISAIAVSLVACLLFFLPYITANDDVRASIDEVLDANGNMQLNEEYGIAVKDLRSLSALKFGLISYQRDRTIDEDGAIFDLVIVGSLFIFALLCLVCAIVKWPALMMFFGLLMAAMDFLIYNSSVNTAAYQPGIAGYGYIVCAVMLAIFGIWMIVEKRKLKKQKQQDNLL